MDYLAILADGDQKLDVILQQTADDGELGTRLLGRAKETGRSDVEHALAVMSKTIFPDMGRA